jgi:hypothetical protein
MREPPERQNRCVHNSYPVHGLEHRVSEPMTL